MKTSLIIAFAFAALITVLAGLGSVTVVNPPFVTTKYTVPKDSATAYLNAGGSDTTGWVAIPDSSAQNGGASVTYWSTEDTTQSLIKAEFGFFDPNTQRIQPVTPTVTLDSMVSGFHTAAVYRNPKTEPLNFRVPRGARYCRIIGTAATTTGQWGTGGLGTKRIPSWDVQFIVPN